MLDPVVIVGGGVTAQRCAFALRTLGFDGGIEMISAETDAPYDRTLVSKDMLARTDFGPPVPLRAVEDYQAAGVSLRLGTHATSLDTAARRVYLSDGDSLAYEQLVVATGGRPVVPQSLAAEGVLTLRTASDLPELHDALERSMHLVIVGAGFIGGEVAAAAVARHCPVTLIEAAPAPLSPLFGEEVGRRFADLHRSRGVEVICGTPVVGITRERDGSRVALRDGRKLRADAVVVGVGMAPNVEWLAGSPLELDAGIVTDACCRTNVPGVIAAGDCARWFNPYYGAHMRVEHWDTAARHGEAAAASVLGIERPFALVPFFWSAQHDAKLQWVGYAPVWDAVEIEEEDGEPGFAAHYRLNDSVVGVLAVNKARALARARREMTSALKEVVAQ